MAFAGSNLTEADLAMPPRLGLRRPDCGTLTAPASKVDRRSMDIIGVGLWDLW